MKKYILLVVFLLFLTGCETGTRYEKNTTTQKVPVPVVQSALINDDDIKALLNDDKEIEGEPYYDDGTAVDSLANTVVKNGLDVVKIREGKHEGYIRLVFDVYDDAKVAKAVGHYDAKYNSVKKDISIILHGYKNFSAPLPSFPHYSLIEQIHFDQYPEHSGFKFHIKLRKNAEVKVFALKNPARIVFDIKAI